MRIISLRGMDNRSNIAITNTFELANKHHCKEVNSIHMMYTLVKNNDIAKMFKSNIGIEPQKYIKLCDDTLGDTYNPDDSQIGTEDISDELSQIFKESIDKAVDNHRLATIFDIYSSIIAFEDAKFWEIVKKLGIERENILSLLENPLDSMPITSGFSVNYNILARDGKFDNIAARDDVIDNIMEILGRRIKSNPCIVGDAGVGKTAVVEGMAQRLVSGNVPWYLKGKHIISVDISSIVSGSKYRGDFEEKLNAVINEVSNRNDVILFFDEFHMLAEAGGSSADSALTASNILKPAISRGSIQIIGATTPAEYKQFIEKDKAFERRLEKVNLAEPSVEDSIKMVNAVIDKYESFHNVQFTRESIESAVILSDRYITNRKLPDKAITSLDETAARIKRVKGINVLIDTADVKETISKLSGVDVSDLDDTSRNKVASMGILLSKHVIGQDKAIDLVSKAVMRSKAGVKDPNRPIGSFLFVGPTGVGKTELSKALAIEFSGSIKNLIRFDMSEFMEKHTVSKLIGATPGYVGYGEGGQLTEAVRNNPYSVILFDEIEKAHADVFNIMLQILDDGQLTDSEGVKVDFKNTLIIMTSNAGCSSNDTKKSKIGFSVSEILQKQELEDCDDKTVSALENTFRPEFLNRIDNIITFNQLSKKDAEKIANMALNKVKNRLKEKSIELKWNNSVIDYIVESGFSTKYGARNINRKVQSLVENKLAYLIISNELSTGDEAYLSYNEELQVNIAKSITNSFKDDIKHKLEVKA